VDRALVTGSGYEAQAGASTWGTDELEGYDVPSTAQVIRTKLRGVSREPGAVPGLAIEVS